MIESESDQIAEEVLLLVSSARSKNIDVALWLTEDGNHGITVAPDFNSKLISLGLIVGMREDGDKKNKLDHAISDSSLRKILTTCNRGVDSLGEPLIDVTHFLRLCDRSLSKNAAVDKPFFEYLSNDSADMRLTGMSKHSLSSPNVHSSILKG